MQEMNSFVPLCTGTVESAGRLFIGVNPERIRNQVKSTVFYPLFCGTAHHNNLAIKEYDCVLRVALKQKPALEVLPGF